MITDNFWDNCVKDFKLWRKLYPGYAPQIRKVEKQFESMRLEHIKNLQEYHYRNRKSCLVKAEDIKAEAEQAYKKLSKLELIASLSK